MPGEKNLYDCRSGWQNWAIRPAAYPTLGVLRLAEPGGMSYASVLSSTAKAFSSLVLGEHGRSRAFLR